MDRKRKGDKQFGHVFSSLGKVDNNDPLSLGNRLSDFI